MKFRESGMPSEDMWKSFFNAAEILTRMDLDGKVRTLIDIGCGYGTFLLPAAQIISRNVIGIDIDENMIEICRGKIQTANISNIRLINGDISKESTIEQLKKDKEEIDYIMLFNILHCERTANLLQNVYAILNKNGKIGVIHWKYENTPRGPSMEIRPKPKDIIEWALGAGFTLEKEVDLPPYHFGLVFKK